MTTVASRLSAHGLFKGVSPERVQSLAAACHTVQHAEGAFIWAEGDPALHVLLVQRGIVQAYRQLGDGTDATVALLGPRECVGLTAVLEAGTYPSAARAVSPAVEVIMLDARALRDAMAHDLALVHAVNTMLLQHANMLRAKIQIMTAGDVGHRLAALFLHLAHRFGDENPQGQVFIPMLLTRRMLAGIVGAREETVIRTLSRWEKDGVLSTGETAFEIHRPQELRVLLP